MTESRRPSPYTYSHSKESEGSTSAVILRSFAAGERRRISNNHIILNGEIQKHENINPVYLMKINVFFLSSLSLSITTLFLIIILLKFGKEKVHKMWALFNLTVFWWGVGATLVSINSSNISLGNVLWRITNLGVAFISVFLLHMVFILTKAKIAKFLFFSYLQAFIFCILTLNTDLIHNHPAKLYFNSFFIPTPGKYYFLYYGSWLTIVSYAHFILVKHLLQQKGIEKKRIGYLFFSLAFGFFCGAINFLYFLNILFYQYCNFGICIYCLSSTYAIFRHQLLGIEVVFRKGLLYSLLIGALTGIYLLVIMLTEWLFRGIMGYKSLFISLSAAFIIAILFNPLRDKIQALVDKLFLGKTSAEISKENELLKQELERSERLKTAGTMALGLAHEIKNPLATIKTFSEFLPEKIKSKTFIEDFSRLVPAEVQRINNIVQNLLDFSKPSSPLLQEVNINEVISDILGLSSSEFLKKKIEIIKSFDDSNPLIKADPNQIKQVIINLLFNAMEAMPEGGVITITTKCLKDTAVKIEISDTGCGIPQKNLKDIFSPFFTTKDTGAGLGLSIVHQIIKEHKGRIEIESEIEKGTRVGIEFNTVEHNFKKV